MPVVIQDFEAVESDEGRDDKRTPQPRPGPVEMAALNSLMSVRRARQMRLWAN